MSNCGASAKFMTTKIELTPPRWAKADPIAWYRYVLREEEILKPAREKLEKTVAENKARKQYEWKADYGKGIETQTKPILRKKDLNWNGEPKTIFDKTLIKIPVSDRIRIHQWEQDKDAHSKPQVYHIPLWTWRKVLYQHLLFKILPLWLVAWHLGPF